MSQNKTGKSLVRLPVLLILAVMMVLAMIRLGIWQLDRASQKQQLLDQVLVRSKLPAIDLKSINRTIDESIQEELRFRPVTVSGEFQAENTIFIENQVLNKRVGYQVFTLFKPRASDHLVMVSRGWTPAGATRAELPTITTPVGEIQLSGRLNVPPAQPPLWKEGYPAGEGRIWQYLPINEFASQIEAKVMPLVIELAPDQAGTEDLVVKWQEINDKWVAKHKAYAFQWFSMSLAFFVACLVLLVRSLRSKKVSDS